MHSWNIWHRIVSRTLKLPMALFQLMKMLFTENNPQTVVKTAVFFVKLKFIVLLHRTSKYVIPRRGKAPTWESPGTMFVFVVFFDRLYQEIATSRKALLAMTW